MLELDLARELIRVWAHARKLSARVPKHVPRLTVHRRSDDWVSGHAWSSGRVHLGVGAGADRAAIAGTLAHEVAHHMSWGANHSDAFWTVLGELVESAYGVKVPTLRGKGYERQKQIEKSIRDQCEWLRASPLKLPRRPAAPGVGSVRVESA